MSKKSIWKRGEPAFLGGCRLCQVGGSGQWWNGWRRQKYVKGCQERKQQVLFGGAHLEESSQIVASSLVSARASWCADYLVADPPALFLMPQEGYCGAALPGV